jgi:hypothetical protein
LNISISSTSVFQSVDSVWFRLPEADTSMRFTQINVNNSYYSIGAGGNNSLNAQVRFNDLNVVYHFDPIAEARTNLGNNLGDWLIDSLEYNDSDAKGFWFINNTSTESEKFYLGLLQSDYVIKYMPDIYPEPLADGWSVYKRGASTAANNFYRLQNDTTWIGSTILTTEAALDSLFDRDVVYRDSFNTVREQITEIQENAVNYNTLDTFFTATGGTIDLRPLCEMYDLIKIQHRMLEADVDSQITYILPDADAANLRVKEIRYNGRSYNGRDDAFLFTTDGSDQFWSFGDFVGQTSTQATTGDGPGESNIVYKGNTYSPHGNWIPFTLKPQRSSMSVNTYYWFVEDGRLDSRFIEYQENEVTTSYQALDSLFQRDYIKNAYSSGDSVYIETEQNLYGMDVGLMTLDTTITHFMGGNVEYDFTYAANTYDIINISVTNTAFGDIVSIVIPDYNTGVRAKTITLSAFNIPGAVITVDGNRLSSSRFDAADTEFSNTVGSDTTYVYYTGNTYFPQASNVYKYTAANFTGSNLWFVQSYQNESHNIAYNENGVETVNQSLDSLFNRNFIQDVSVSDDSTSIVTKDSTYRVPNSSQEFILFKNVYASNGGKVLDTLIVPVGLAPLVVDLSSRNLQNRYTDVKVQVAAVIAGGNPSDNVFIKLPNSGGKLQRIHIYPSPLGASASYYAISSDNISSSISTMPTDELVKYQTGFDSLVSHYVNDTVRIPYSTSTLFTRVGILTTSETSWWVDYNTSNQQTINSIQDQLDDLDGTVSDFYKDQNDAVLVTSDSTYRVDLGNLPLEDKLQNQDVNIDGGDNVLRIGSGTPPRQIIGVSRQTTQFSSTEGDVNFVANGEGGTVKITSDHITLPNIDGVNTVQDSVLGVASFVNDTLKKLPLADLATLLQDSTQFGEASLTLDTILYQGQDWSPTVEFLSNYQIINITLKGNSVVSADSTVITLPEADTLLRNTIIKITGLTVSINSLPVVYFEDSDVSYYFDIVSDNSLVNKIDDLVVSSTGSFISNGNGLVASNERFYPAGYDYIIVYKDELEAIEIPGIKLVEKGYSVYKRGSSPSSYNSYYNASQSTTLRNVDQALDTLFLVASALSSNAGLSRVDLTASNADLTLNSSTIANNTMVLVSHAEAINGVAASNTEISFPRAESSLATSEIFIQVYDNDPTYSVQLVGDTFQLTGVNSTSLTLETGTLYRVQAVRKPSPESPNYVWRVDPLNGLVNSNSVVYTGNGNTNVAQALDDLYTSSGSNTELDSLLAKVDAETDDTLTILRPVEISDVVDPSFTITPANGSATGALNFDMSETGGYYNHQFATGTQGFNVISN